MAKLIENLDIFLDEFATDAYFSDRRITYKCIFDNDYSPMNITNTEGREITATFKESDIQANNVHHGDVVTIDGKPYTVIGIQPQMDGFVVLELRE